MVERLADIRQPDGLLIRSTALASGFGNQDSRPGPAVCLTGLNRVDRPVSDWTARAWTRPHGLDSITPGGERAELFRSYLEAGRPGRTVFLMKSPADEVPFYLPFR